MDNECIKELEVRIAPGTEHALLSLPPHTMVFYWEKRSQTAETQMGPSLRSLHCGRWEGDAECETRKLAISTPVPIELLRNLEAMRDPALQKRGNNYDLTVRSPKRSYKVDK